MYKNSGVSDVLDSVLKTVASQVVRRCIESAIEVCTRVSKNLITDVNIRLHGLKLMGDRLHQEIKDLNQDLIDLAEIEKGQLVAMKEISATLENELMRIFRNSLNECNLQVERIFHPDNEQWIDAAEKIRKKEEEQTESQIASGAILFTSITGGYVMHSVRNDGDFSLGAIFGALFGWTVFQQVMKFLRGTENEIQFNSKEDANKFINGITEMANELSKSMYNAIEKQVSDACNKSCKNFYSLISERMMDILRRANDRLNSTFDVNQIIPNKIHLKLKEIHLDVDDIGRIQQYCPTSLFQLVSIKPKESGSTWILSRSKLQEKCVESIKANLKRIQIDIVENTNNEMKQNFTSLFNDLQAYLIKYKGHAERCVSDKKLTEEKQAEFESKLQELNECLIDKAKDFEDFTEIIDWDKLN